MYLCTLPRIEALLVAHCLQEILGVATYPLIFHTNNGEEFVGKSILKLLRDFKQNILTVLRVQLRKWTSLSRRWWKVFWIWNRDLANIVNGYPGDAIELHPFDYCFKKWSLTLGGQLDLLWGWGNPIAVWPWLVEVAGWIPVHLWVEDRMSFFFLDKLSAKWYFLPCFV